MSEISAWAADLFSDWGIILFVLSVPILFVVLLRLVFDARPEQPRGASFLWRWRRWPRSEARARGFISRPRNTSLRPDEYNAQWSKNVKTEDPLSSLPGNHVAADAASALDQSGTATNVERTPGLGRMERVARALENVDRRMAQHHSDLVAIGEVYRASVAKITEQERKRDVAAIERNFEDLIAICEQQLRVFEASMEVMRAASDRRRESDLGSASLQRQQDLDRIEADMQRLEERLKEAVTAAHTATEGAPARVLGGRLCDDRLAALMSAISLLPRSERFDQAFKVISIEMGYLFCEKTAQLGNNEISETVERLRQWLADQGIRYSYFVPGRGEGFDPKTHEPASDLSTEKCMGRTILSTICWGIQRERGTGNSPLISRAKVLLD